MAGSGQRAAGQSRYVNVASPGPGLQCVAGKPRKAYEKRTHHQLLQKGVPLKKAMVVGHTRHRINISKQLG